jgi:hypothetical protein
MTKVISAITLLLALNSYAQKFTVIENKGKNSKYFNYNDPNSFIGVLMNNLSAIPNMIVSNEFQGVYNDISLQEIGIDPSSMLQFYTANPITFFSTVLQYENVVVKTNQSSKEYLDSLRLIDPDILLGYDVKKFEENWNISQENMSVKNRANFYFDIRNISALLIEQRDSSNWIHFIKSLPNGRSFISLSLTESQLKQADCFLFWHFLTEEESDNFKSRYKKISSEFKINGWKHLETKYVTQIDYTWINNSFYLNNASCSNSNSTFGDLSTHGNFHSQHFFSKSYPVEVEIHELRQIQNIGDVVRIYRPWMEDTIEIIKTSQSFENFMDSMRLDQNNEELFWYDSDEIKKWWNTTEINYPIRRDPKSTVLWKDAMNSKLAISYTVSADQSNPKIYDVFLYTKQNNLIVPIHQCNDDYSALNSDLMTYLSSCKLNVTTAQNWLNFLDTTPITMDFFSIQKSLNLINKSTQF